MENTKRILPKGWADSVSLLADKILDSKEKNGEAVYLVQWKSSWETAKTLLPFEELIQQYWEGKRKDGAIYKVHLDKYAKRYYGGMSSQPAIKVQNGKIHRDLIFSKNPVTGESEYIEKVMTLQGKEEVTITKGLPPEPNIKKKRADNIVWVKPGVVIRSIDDNFQETSVLTREKWVQTPYSFFPKKMRNMSILLRREPPHSNISGVVQLNNKISRGIVTEMSVPSSTNERCSDKTMTNTLPANFIKVPKDQQLIFIKAENQNTGTAVRTGTPMLCSLPAVRLLPNILPKPGEMSTPTTESTITTSDVIPVFQPKSYTINPPANFLAPRYAVPVHQLPVPVQNNISRQTSSSPKIEEKNSVQAVNQPNSNLLREVQITRSVGTKAVSSANAAQSDASLIPPVVQVIHFEPSKGTKVRKINSKEASRASQLELHRRILDIIPDPEDIKVSTCNNKNADITSGQKTPTSSEEENISTTIPKSSDISRNVTPFIVKSIPYLNKETSIETTSLVKPQLGSTEVKQDVVCSVPRTDNDKSHTTILSSDDTGKSMNALAAPFVATKKDESNLAMGVLGEIDKKAVEVEGTIALNKQSPEIISTSNSEKVAPGQTELAIEVATSADNLPSKPASSTITPVESKASTESTATDFSEIEESGIGNDDIDFEMDSIVNLEEDVDKRELVKTMPPMRNTNKRALDGTQSINLKEIPDIIEFEYEPWKVAKEIDDSLTCFTTIESNSRKLFKCGKCTRTFKQEKGVIFHIRYIHYGWYPYHCPLCKQGYLDRREVYKHMDAHLGIKQYPCSTCGTMFLNTEELRKHYKEHYYERRFQCDVCGERFGRKSALAGHQLIHDLKKQFACEYCARTFTFLQDYKTHERIHTGEKPYKCSQCDKAYRRKEHLTHHMFVHTGKSLYQCKICEDYFQVRKQLNQHLKFKHDDVELLKSVYDHFCSLCFSVFDNKQYLDRHERKKHLVELKKRVYCRVCKLPCQTWADKRRHEFKYHSDKNIKDLPKSIDEIDVAGMKSTTTSGNTSPGNKELPAINKENDKSQHQCVLCDRHAANLVSLAKHYDTHSKTDGEKNEEEKGEENIEIVDNASQLKYKCSYCNFGFKECSELFQHEKSHKTYPQGITDCFDCSVNFKFPAGLVKHLESGHASFKWSITNSNEQKVENVEKTACNICGKKCTESYMEWHMASQHDGRTDNFYKCSTCGVLLQTKRELERHGHFKCPYCSDQVKSRAKLLKHFKDYHTCTHCDVNYARTEDLKVHLHIKHFDRSPKRIYTCLQCPDTFVFVDKDDLKSHFRIKHDIPANQIERKSFKMVSAETKLYETIEEVLNKTVKFDDDVLKKPALLESQNDAQKDVGDVIVEGKKTTKKKHEKKKQDKKKQVCATCDLVFADTKELEEHVLTHSKTKEVAISKMSMCKKRKNLKTTDESETAGKKKKASPAETVEPKNKFKCKICNTFFPTLEHVRKHVPIHFKTKTENDESV